MKNWFAIAVAISLANVCLAQTPTKEKVSITKFSMDMIEGGRIDPMYKGLPIAEVFDTIEKLSGPKKGEFESTDDFKTRKAAALTGKLIGDSNAKDVFAFVAEVTHAEIGSPPVIRFGLNHYFNADTHKLSLSVWSQQNENRKGLDRLYLNHETVSTDTYQASNTFGSSVTVKKTVWNTWGIVANRIPFFDNVAEGFGSSARVHMKMENAKAEKELQALKALVVMRLSFPYIVRDVDRHVPTMDEPLEWERRFMFLNGDVLGVVFYSGLTGEVFARLPDSFGKHKPVTALPK